eukprot:XP_001697041.1 predicted protein [Chlamydomonas reinhardtii]
MEPLSAGGGEEQGGAAAGALAPRTQPRLARHRTRLGGVREAEGGAAPVTSEEQESHGRQPGPEGEDEEPAPSATEDESEGQEVQDASDCQEDDVNGNTRTRRGRLVLGRRLVSFRTGPRNTVRRPSSRLTATATMITSPGARAASAAARPAANRVSAAAAAVALLSPPRGALALALCDDEDEEAMLRGLLDDEDDLPPPPLPGPPSAATNAQSPQGEAGSDQRLHTPAADDQPVRALRPATGAAAGASAAAAAAGAADDQAHLSGGQAVASPRPMLSEDEGDAAEAPPQPGVPDAEQQAPAPVPAPLPPLEAAGVAQELLQNLNSPPPLQVVGRLLTGGSTRSSFGLPEVLLGANGVGGAAVAGHAASPGDDLPAADWNVVGSPPTSSLLALLQAGLLQTPTGTPGASPGPSILRAPVQQDMPQVTPGISNQWSDVQAVSWSEWRNIHAGFGVLSRVPGLACGSAAGTPDNTRTLARTASAAESARGVGFTPRRDMFVRPPGCQGAAAAGCSPRPPPLHIGAAGSVECDADNEGHGGTRSLLTSPSGSVSRVRRSAHRRASADEAILRLAAAGHDLGAAATAGAVAGPSSRPGSARGHPGMSPSAGLRMSPAVARTTCELAQEAALPDFCSPSKRQRMATSEPGHVAGPQLGQQQRQQQQLGGLAGPSSGAALALGGLSAAGGFGARLPLAPRFGTSMLGSVFGAAGKQAGERRTASPHPCRCWPGFKLWNKP